MLAAAALLAGCPNESGTSGTTTTTTVTTTETPACATDKRAQVYAVGLQGKSTDGAITITFVDADPAPPAKGNNTWTVKIEDSAGKPVNGAEIKSAVDCDQCGNAVEKMGS